MSLTTQEELGSAAYAGVYDVVNIAEPNLKFLINEMRGMGGAPISISAMPNGVDYMVNALSTRVAKMGTIDLLRIHGHGAPGIQTISCGMHLRKKDLTTSRAILSTYNFEHLRATLVRLNGCFAPDAKVWLLGCEVGAERQGWDLIHKLSSLWRVEVTAGVPTQYGGSAFTTLVHEGNTITCLP